MALIDDIKRPLEDVAGKLDDQGKATLQSVLQRVHDEAAALPGQVEQALAAVEPQAKAAAVQLLEAFALDLAKAAITAA